MTQNTERPLGVLRRRFVDLSYFLHGAGIQLNKWVRLKGEDCPI
ncbi:hypothetical protein XCR1_4720002 [Xenorhabdus cabanillasii JM26]|uniref:Uncharacterized protein n=1 Tax=Xenorhabdus cabanillasii JM26 TaxID=1427517 RepID=W1J9P3_9GAMM|nr:hypothetical protein XCR1_4720002 [Xenorhabdus cabanillasii JM26]